MGRQAPDGLVGIHTNLLVAALALADHCRRSPNEERAALDAIATFRTSGFGYYLEQATRPQTIGYALLDSPVALAAWMLDHDTDSYDKISRAFLDGQPAGDLTRDRIVDNITLYWLTGTGASAARSYWESRTSSSRSCCGRPGSSGCLDPGRLHHVPRRGLRGHRAAGSRRSTPASPTSTRSTRAATSPPGRSRSCSPTRSEPHSSHCAEESHNPHQQRRPCHEHSNETAIDIRPFQVEVPEEKLDDLRRRIAATRWPTKELVADRSQGVQLATVQELARYWTTDYDWRKAEAKLNALPQFTTEIDGVDIHFIHVRSEHEDALPLIMTHGWPGSVIELLETIGPLTDPTAHGGSAEDAFHLVLPSIARLRLLRRADRARLGRRPHRARAWAELMQPPRLHPLRRPGRRRGRPRHRPDGPPGGRGFGRLPPEPARGGARDRRSTARRNPNRNAQRATRSRRSGKTASATSSRWRRGRRRSATPCWIHRSGWRPGCSITTRTATTRSPRAFVDGEPVGNLTRESIVDNITLYWLTGTGASAARSYWEDGRALAAALASGQPPPAVTRAGRLHDVPRRDLGVAPRSWVEAVYPGLAYFNEVDRGGHFAAWEEPELFSEEVRAAFGSLR